jgi:hypothetical protein
MEEQLEELSERIGDAAGQFKVHDVSETTPETIRCRNIARDIGLATRSLENLDRFLKEHHRLHRGLFAEDGSPIDDEERVRDIFEESRVVQLDIELCIRQLYELLYALKLLIEQGPPGAQTLASDDMAELRRLCIYRDSLVVHKERTHRTLGGLMFNSRDGSDLRIGIPLEPMSNDDSNRLQAIFHRAKPGLPDECQDEVNWNEQLQQIYEHWTTIESGDMGDAKALIRRNGVRSDDPVVLAKMVLALARVFLRSEEAVRRESTS